MALGEQIHGFQHADIFLPRLLLKFCRVRLFDTEPTVLQPILLISKDSRPFVTRGRFDTIWLRGDTCGSSQSWTMLSVPTIH
jgi:hypothetical protein